MAEDVEIGAQHGREDNAGKNEIPAIVRPGALDRPRPVRFGHYLGGKLSDPTVVSWFNNATPFWTAALLCLLNIILLLVRFAETLKTKINTKITPFTGFVNIGRAWNMINLRRVFIVVFFLATGFTFFTQFFQLFLLKRLTNTKPTGPNICHSLKSYTPV